MCASCRLLGRLSVSLPSAAALSQQSQRASDRTPASTHRSQTSSDTSTSRQHAQVRQTEREGRQMGRADQDVDHCPSLRVQLVLTASRRCICWLTMVQRPAHGPRRLDCATHDDATRGLVHRSAKQTDGAQLAQCLVVSSGSSGRSDAICLASVRVAVATPALAVFLLLLLSASSSSAAAAQSLRPPLATSSPSARRSACPRSVRSVRHGRQLSESALRGIRER